MAPEEAQAMTEARWKVLAQAGDKPYLRCGWCDWAREEGYHDDYRTGYDEASDA